MKVLHVVPTYLPAVRYGGPIHSVHGLCAALAAEGVEVDVFTTCVDGPDNLQVPLGQPVSMDGVRVFYFSSPLLRRLFYSPAMARELRRQITKYDIAHLHSVFLYPTWAAARAARARAIPYLLAPRGMLVRDLIRQKSSIAKTMWIRLIERENIARCAGLHVTTEAEKKEFMQLGLDCPRIFQLPNGISPPPIPENHGRGGNCPPYVLFLGRINWKKGLDRLIEAWRWVCDADLWIAGNDEENYQPKLEKLSRQTGNEKRIRFLGPVDNENKWDLYRNASLFVLPSTSENFGNVVLEAMAMECSVLVSPGVGLAPVVSASGAGLVVSSEPEALGLAIQGLLKDPRKRAEMGRQGRQEVVRNFTWQSIARQTMEVYGSVLEGKK